jgi:predicted acyltransferase
MRKVLGLSAVVVVGAAVLLSSSPTVSLAETSAGNKCGERANPVDQKTEHRYQTDGICVTGGEYHTEWWLDPCVPLNHTSAAC